MVSRLQTVLSGQQAHRGKESIKTVSKGKRKKHGKDKIEEDESDR